MIAACPKCGARYRIERERLQAGGVRLRCARCEAVFRVRPPDAPEPKPPPPAPPPARPEAKREAPAPVVTPTPLAPAPPPPPAGAKPSGSVLLAMPDGELASKTAAALAQRGLVVLRATDGVEAMLEIQRKLPRAVVLAAELPRMFGFQICELVKRNESLRGTWVVLVGAIHHRERYRRAPGELYGADAYVDGTELPGGLLPLLARGGVGLAPAPAPPPEAPAPPAPRASAAPPARRPDGLADERLKAERLARIVISDIVLYNEERFAAAVRAGNVLEAMAADLAEGRQLFEERIDARVRAERDHLKEELLRCARTRGVR